MNQPYSFLELRFLMLLGRLERSLEVVHDRQQLLDESLGGPSRESLLLAGGALAVVLELRREPLEFVQVRLCIGLRGRAQLLVLATSLRVDRQTWILSGFDV